jgi:flagellar biosynthesis/type III secretory pathway chaperone
MVDDVIELMSSLTMVMEEESTRLRSHKRGGDLSEMATVKIRLVGMLETELARLERNCMEWAKALDSEEQERLTEAFGMLSIASTDNASILERQMTLSAQMLDAVTAEARRLAGKRAATYGARGAMEPDCTAPISVNSQY